MKSVEMTSFIAMGLLVAQIPTGWAQTAASAGQLEEVVITAERRESDVQKTATSVSVRTGSELLDQGRITLGQILEDVPGVTGGAANAPVPGGSGVDTSAPGVTIRGIVSNSGAVGNVTSAAAAAAVYVDGVYEGVGGGYDIDRVEILRGPQGTLYGRSATSGLLAIHTNDPKLDHLGGDAVVELGNYNLRHYTGVLNLPLVDNVLGIRVAGNRRQQDGYFSAAGGALTSTDGKIKVLYKPNDNFSLLVGYALQNNDTHNGGITITLDTPDTYCFEPASKIPCAATPIGRGSNDFRQYWALLNWNLGFATLSYQPAYRTWTSDTVTYTRGPTPPQNVDSTITVPRDHFNTQELHLSSNPGSKLIWQAGAEYYDNSLSSHLVVKLISLGITPIDALLHDKTTRAVGAFAEATYPVTASSRVTAGVRYDHTKVSVDESYAAIAGPPQTLAGEAGTRRFDNFTYKARLEHDLTAQNLLYASVSSGFSPGDVAVSTGATGNPFVINLKAETLTAYEIGTKNRFLDNRLQVNGAVYYYDYGGYQTAAINISGATGVGTAALSSPAQVLGGELETIFQLTPNDRASVGLAYTDAYFVDKKRAFDTGGGSTVTFGQFFVRDQIPNVTPATVNLSYEHVFHLPGDSTLSLHGAARYLSEHALTNLPLTHSADGSYAFIHVGAQWVGDLNVTWASAGKRVSVTGYARNVANNQYKSAAFIQDVLGASTKLATPYDPRTYGAILNVHF